MEYGERSAMTDSGFRTAGWCADNWASTTTVSICITCHLLICVTCFQRSICIFTFFIKFMLFCSLLEPMIIIIVKFHLTLLN